MSFMNIFRPDAVIIGGGISKEGDYLINKVKAYCEKYSYVLQAKKEGFKNPLFF